MDIRGICKKFNTNVGDVRGANRSPSVSLSRAFVAYALVHKHGLSINEAATAMNKDAQSIRYGLNRINSLLNLVDTLEAENKRKPTMENNL